MPPPLAQAADLLSAEFRSRVRNLARLLKGESGALDTAFLRWLGRRRFEAREAKALGAITFGAAVRLLAQKKSLADFFEQVEYNGRRLAKLDVTPVSVLEALSAYDRLLARRSRAISGSEREDWRWAAGQLGFCVVLALNNAFYQVREAETQAFFDLHDAELGASTEGELLEAYLGILARFCHADAACAILFDSSRQAPVACGVPMPLAAGFPLQSLATPRLMRAGNGAVRRLLDPSWAGRYVSAWSVPLGAAGAMQFAFRKEYQWLPRELRLLAGAAGRCVMAAEKLRLTGQLAAREGEVRELAERMLQVEERERRRISRELHDEAGQLLPYVRLQLEMIERDQDTPPAMAKRLAEAREAIGRTVLEIRRVLSDLSPAILEQLGLAAAVRQLLIRLRQTHAVSTRLEAHGLETLPEKTAILAYRLIQECCNNVARHSSASNLNVSLAAADGRLKMRIQDDGVGFRVAKALAKPDSFGLAGMRERVALAGGKLEIASAPGRGVRVSASIPIPAAAGAAAKPSNPHRRAGRRA
jgi:signal transduction histidine kinase